MGDHRVAAGAGQNWTHPPKIVSQEFNRWGASPLTCTVKSGPETPLALTLRIASSGRAFSMCQGQADDQRSGPAPHVCTGSHRTRWFRSVFFRLSTELLDCKKRTTMSGITATVNSTVSFLLLFVFSKKAQSQTLFPELSTSYRESRTEFHFRLLYSDRKVTRLASQSFLCRTVFPNPGR